MFRLWLFYNEDSSGLGFIGIRIQAEKEMECEMETGAVHRLSCRIGIQEQQTNLKP